MYFTYRVSLLVLLSPLMGLSICSFDSDSIPSSPPTKQIHHNRSPLQSLEGIPTEGLCAWQSHRADVCTLTTFWKKPSNIVSLYAFDNTCKLIGHEPQMGRGDTFAFWTKTLKHSIVMWMHESRAIEFSYAGTTYSWKKVRTNPCSNKDGNWVCQLKFRCGAD